MINGTVLPLCTLSKTEHCVSQDFIAFDSATVCIVFLKTAFFLHSFSIDLRFPSFFYLGDMGTDKRTDKQDFFLYLKISQGDSRCILGYSIQHECRSTAGLYSPLKVSMLLVCFKSCKYFGLSLILDYYYKMKNVTLFKLS